MWFFKIAGFQEDLVVQTIGWFCTFNQAEDVNAIRIWVAEKDRRYLSGGTVQVWSGGAWVDHHRFENPYDDVNGNGKSM